jgi:hypothetical protein
MKILLILFISLLGLAGSNSANAYALAGQDDPDTCWFTNNTMHFMLKRLPNTTNATVTQDVVKAMAEIVRTNCKNGQVLMMGDILGYQNAKQIFDTVGMMFCQRPDIESKPMLGTPTEYAFQTRCTIKKLPEPVKVEAEITPAVPAPPVVESKK